MALNYFTPGHRLVSGSDLNLIVDAVNTYVGSKILTRFVPGFGMQDGTRINQMIRILNAQFSGTLRRFEPGYRLFRGQDFDPIITFVNFVISGGGGLTYNFGALTRAGAGGIALPAGATSIASGTATGYTVTGGYVVPTGNGSASAGTLIFDNGVKWILQLIAGAYSVRQWSECSALLALGATLSGATVRVRSGTYDNSGYNFYGTQIKYASRVIWQAEDPANKPIFTKWQFAGPGGTALGNVTLKNLDIYTPAPTVGLPYNTINVNIISGSADTSDVTVDGCILRSDMLPYNQGGRLIGNIASVNFVEGSQNIVISNNTIRRVVVGIYMAANGFEISGNDVDLGWGDSFVCQSGAQNGVIKNNHCSGVYGDQAFLHRDCFQLQPTTNSPISNIDIVGNTIGVDNAWLTQGAAVGNVGVQIVTYTASRTLVDDDCGKEVRISATAGAVALQLPAATVGKQIILRRTDSSGNAITVAAAGTDTLPGPPALTTTGTAYAIICFTDGTWEYFPEGLRPQTLPRRASFTAGSLETTRIIFAEAINGLLTITLPSVGTGPWDFVIRKDDTTANFVRIVTPDGSLSTGGSTIDLKRICATKRFQNSGGVWTVTEYGPGTQGLFSNAHPTGAIFNITFRGNIIWVLDPHGVRIEQDVAGFSIYNNTILRPFPPDLDGDGIGPADGWVAAAVGNINAAGNTAFASRNISSGQLLLTNGATGTRNIALNLSDPNNLTPMTNVFTGTTAADFRPLTRAQVVAAAQPKVGGPAQPGSLIGATDYWDFVNGEQKLITAVPAVQDISPANGATTVDPAAVIAITYDFPMQRGTGNLILRNVTDGVDVETFNVASSGQIKIVGEVIYITPTASMLASKSYTLIDPAGAFKSVYGVNAPTISGYGFTVSAPVTFNKVNFGGAVSQRLLGVIAAPAQALTWGCRFRPSVTTTGQVLGAMSTQGTFLVSSIAAPNWRITTKDNSLVENCRINTTTGPLTTDTPKTLLVAIDLSQNPAVAYAYLDGVLISSVATLVQGSTIALDRATAGFSIGSNMAGSSGFFSGDMEFEWFHPAFVDISQAGNRAKFAAANIGTNGEGPLGFAPLIYRTGLAAEWNAGTNRGTGGTFTVSGAVTNA